MRPNSANTAALMLAEFTRVVSPYYLQLREELAANAGAQLTLATLQYETANAKANNEFICEFGRLLPKAEGPDAGDICVDSVADMRLVLAHAIWRPEDCQTMFNDQQIGPYYFIGQTSIEQRTTNSPNRKMLLLSAVSQPKLFYCKTWQPEIEAFLWQRDNTEGGRYKDEEEAILAAGFDHETSKVCLNPQTPHAITIAYEHKLTLSPKYPRGRADIPPEEKLAQSPPKRFRDRRGGIMATRATLVEPHLLTDEFLAEHGVLDNLNRLAKAFQQTEPLAQLFNKYTISTADPVDEAIAEAGLDPNSK